VLAVGHDDETGFLAVQKFLDHHPLAGRAKSAPLNIPRMAAIASSSLCARITPLPAARPSALTTTGAPISRMIGFRRVGIGEALITGGRNVVAGQKILGEGFGAFQLRRGFTRPETAQSGID
jgi:hypothetical protein